MIEYRKKIVLALIIINQKINTYIIYTKTKIFNYPQCTVSFLSHAKCVQGINNSVLSPANSVTLEIRIKFQDKFSIKTDNVNLILLSFLSYKQLIEFIHLARLNIADLAFQY